MIEVYIVRHIASEKYKAKGKNLVSTLAGAKVYTSVGNAKRGARLFARGYRPMYKYEDFAIDVFLMTPLRTIELKE